MPRVTPSARKRVATMRTCPPSSSQVLAAQDADCAKALWAIDQPPHTLDLATIVR
jgi:hypothetical protein